MKVYVVVKQHKKTHEVELVVGYRTELRATEEIEDFCMHDDEYTYWVDAVDVYNDLMDVYNDVEE